MCCRVVRLEFDRALVFAQSAGEIDFAKEEHFPKCEMCFGSIGIKPESFEGRVFGFRVRVEPVYARPKGKDNVGAGETGVSQRVIWITRDRLLVKRNCFWNVVAGTLLPQ